MKYYYTKTNPHKIPDPKTYGWQNDATLNLLDIAKDLPNVQLSTNLLDEITAPTPWSRFISFESLLLNGDNRTFNQWAGLLSIIALKNSVAADISIDTINLLGANNLYESIFVNNILLQIPQNSIFDNNDWGTLYCIRINGIDIGFLSNSTLVCAPYYHNKAAKSEIQRVFPFLTDGSGNFINPGNYFTGIANSDRAITCMTILANWFEHLLNNINVLSNTQQTSPHAINITNLLNIINRLPLFSNHINNNLTAYNINLTNITPQNNINSLITATNIVVNKPGKSDLKASNNLIILNLKSIRRTARNEINAATIRVYENMYYNEITDNVKSGTNTINGISVYNMVYIDEDLLLNELHLIEEGYSSNVFCNSNTSINFNNKNYHIIWPIDSVLKDYINWDILKSAVEHDYRQGDNSITISLSLDLGDDKYTHVIRKEYSTIDNGKNKIIFHEPTELPFIAIWPYIKEDYWNRYTIFQVSSDTTFKVQYSNSNLQPYDLSSFTEGKADAFKYIEVNEIPKVLTFHDTNDNFLGIVFMDQPTQNYLANPNTTWNIGIDFGTSSTTAFYKNATTQDINATFVDILPKYTINNTGNILHPTTMNDVKILCNSDAYINFDDQYFIDREILSRNAYATAIEELSDNPNNIIAASLTTNRMFLNNPTNMTKLITDNTRAQRIMNNLKWSLPIQTSHYLHQFLLSVVLYAIKNNVSICNFRFSYPTSMTNAYKNQFINNTIVVIKNIRQAMEGKSITIAELNSDSFYSESVSIAEYFQRKPGANYIGEFCCIDIGGGSTDIAVWNYHQNATLYQTSIKYASQDIFILPMKKMITADNNAPTSFLNIIKDKVLSERIKYIRNPAHDTRINFETYIIESVLFEYTNYISNQRPAWTDTDEKLLFKTQVAVGFIGMLYYVCDIIIDLYVNNQLTQNAMTIALSGNGSKMYEWICDVFGDMVNTTTHINQKISTHINKKLNKNNINIDIQYNSTAHKTEAAAGLTYIDGDAFRNTEDQYMSGFDISANGKSYKAHEDIAGVKSLLDGDGGNIAVSIDNIDKLYDFINFYNSIIDQQEAYKLNYRQNGKNIEQLLNVAFNSCILKGDFYPPFIVGVKYLFDKITQENINGTNVNIN